MNKKLILIIGVVLVCLGVVISQFGDVQIVDVSGFAVAVLGAAITADQILKKADDDKKAKTIISIVCIAVGTVLLAFAGISEATLTELIAGVAGLLILIIGIITSGSKAKK